MATSSSSSAGTSINSVFKAATKWDQAIPQEVEVKSDLAPLLVALSNRNPSRNPNPRIGDDETGDLATNYSIAAVSADSTCSSLTSNDSTSTSSTSTSSNYNVERADIIPGKEVFLLSNCFSADECLCIIRESNIIGFGRTEYPKHYRGNLRLILHDPGLAAFLWGRISHLCPTEVFEDGRTWTATGLNECFRLSKYVAGDQFQRHVDASFEKSSTEKSMFTVNIYLNNANEFSGGSTRFYSDTSGSGINSINSGSNSNSNSGLTGSSSSSTDVPLLLEHSVAPNSGVALVFRQPTAARYMHDGELVISGEKYLIRTDIMYCIVLVNKKAAS